MDFNQVTKIETCFNYISQNKDFLNFVYYSHIPTAIIALIIGALIFIKNRKELISKILLGITLTFFLYLSLDLLIWTNYDSRKIMFSWSLLGVLYALFFLLSLYFTYVFLDKKDISFIKKIILFLLILPVVVLTPTNFNLTHFDSPNCQATEGNLFVYYYQLLGLATAIWIIILAIVKFRKSEKLFRKQIILLTVGIELFLLSFFFAVFINFYLLKIGYITDIVSYRIEQYGIFGMTIFMAFIGYLIVKFKAFNIKVIAAQAFIIALIALNASLYAFFDQSTPEKIIISITLILNLGIGWQLIKSVKLEVQRKEELQAMTEKLAIANDQLRKLDNAKDEFISIASHQLRTPLTAVKGFVSLMLEGSYGKMSREQEDVLNKVYVSNQRLVDLVEDMLNLSRIEAGRMQFDWAPMKMEDVCQEIYDTFILKAKEHDLSLDLILPKEQLPEATTDKNKVREIISNLVDNAIKYTPQGGVKVTASQVGENVRVAVTDTGIGVPQEEMPYLFEKFSRGKDTSRLNTGGTGLGLHVGKRMMAELKGKIWVESEGAGKGSTFFVEVPIEKK